MLVRVTGKGGAAKGAAQWGIGAIAGLAAWYSAAAAAAAGAPNCCCCWEPHEAKVARTKALGVPWLARLDGFIPKFVVPVTCNTVHSSKHNSR